MSLSQAGGLIKTEDVKFICLDSVDSTNLEAERLIRAGSREKLFIVANEQTAGKGRSGKSFYSPGGTGVYMSLVLHPEAPLAQAVSVTTRVSVAAARAIDELTGKTSQIKWVNDIFLDGRKVCGILVKALSDYTAGITHSLIIGIGVNVSTTDFPEEIKHSAGSLCVSLQFRARLAAKIADGVFRCCADLTDIGYLAEYRRRSLVIGKRIDYYINGKKNTALAVDIDGKGGLIIESGNGCRETLTGGEISVRLSEE